MTVGYILSVIFFLIKNCFNYNQGIGCGIAAAVNNSYVLQAVDGGLGKDYLPIRY